MKPQVGILTAAHSYSKQYIQSYESLSILQVHTRSCIKGPRHTAVYVHFYVTSLGRGLLVSFR